MLEMLESFMALDWSTLSYLELVGVCGLLLLGFRALVFTLSLLRDLCAFQPPRVEVSLTKEESEDTLSGYPKFDPAKLKGEQKTIHLWDPSTLDYFGSIPAMQPSEVNEAVSAARQAQDQWRSSSFATRKLLMRTMLRYITENQEACARVAVRESGKTVLDAMVGEVLVTCEKLAWLANHGEQYLVPESRAVGRMMIMKKVCVEYVPLGVIGAIVPWNYPFHNVFNPVSAALFSGNAIVIKVSEYASWSIRYYESIIHACLDAVGAPRDLVRFVVGYGPTGSALVTSGVDKVIFVGSPGVGALVAKAASANLTPVILELGGKDPFVVCEDSDVNSIVQTAIRGVWQNMGQNCAGPERFLVYEGVFDEFCDKVTAIVKKLKTGASLGDPFVDCGSICMGPRQLLHYQSLVDDAVAKGAKVLAGGHIPDANKGFYPPTVLAGVSEDARIMQEEIFGPIMCIFKVPNNSDDEAVRVANNCNFALSSCVFSGSAARAKTVASQLHAGMSSVNDLEGCTYMSQSLPFGGLKHSGYGRFAGPEGLRGLCSVRSVCEDRIPFIRNSIPPPMAYPSTGQGPGFAMGMVKMFFSTSVVGQLHGVWLIIKNSLTRPKRA